MNERESKNMYGSIIDVRQCLLVQLFERKVSHLEKKYTAMTTRGRNCRTMLISPRANFIFIGEFVREV